MIPSYCVVRLPTDTKPEGDSPTTMGLVSFMGMGRVAVKLYLPRAKIQFAILALYLKSIDEAG